MVTADTLLQGRYLVQRPIRQGGMGAVYEAVDQRLGITVALKETHFTDGALRKAFEREARLLASLRHPALPVVSDHFLEGDGQFLVMQFIPGDDLAVILKQNRAPFLVDEVVRWADQLLDALEYLHTQQPPVIHRDIKPHNLKLTLRRDIILLDFGLAKSVSSQTTRLTAAVSVVGYTLEYAPLEQILGEGTDARSDLYALAATLYYLMTGASPPDARSRTAALLDGRPDPLRPAHEVNPRVPPRVAAILHDALAVRPDRRPASAATMREVLGPPRAFPTPERSGGHPDARSAAQGTDADEPLAVSRVLATVLFTDIVKSTELANQLGDRVWRHLLEAHNTLVREQLAQCRGREVKFTGDGFVALFERPAQAIRCACAIRDAMPRLGIQIRAGLHTGECEIRPSDDVAGVAVHMAARVLSKAGPSEVLVSRTVRDSVRGAGIAFDERGGHELKGFPGTHELFAVPDPQRDQPAPAPRHVLDRAPAADLPLSSESRPRPTATLVNHLRQPRIWLALAAAALAISMVVFLANQASAPGARLTRIAPPAITSGAAGSTAPPGTVLYQADWSGGLGGWSGGPDWRTANGMLVNDGARERSIILAPYRPETPDYAVEAEIQRTDTNAGYVSFALLARGDLRRGYWAGAHVGTGRSPMVGLDAELVGEVKELVRRSFDPGREWHQYRIDVRGNSIRMYLDGGLVADVVDDSYRTGVETGLWSWGTQINVRSFRVLAL